MSQPDVVTHRSFSTSSARALHSPYTRGSSIAKDSAYSWAICVAAFIVQTITVGILNAFGVIFVALLEEFKVSKAELSWIGSLAFGLSLGLGPLAGAARVRFGARVVISSGGLICAIAMLTSSFVPNTLALFGTFSLLYAIGGSLIINSTTILAPDYFDKYVAITTGIIVAGASVGTLLFSCLAEIWVDSVGWRNTFRIYAGISVVTVIMGLLIRPVKRPVPVITVTAPTPSAPAPRLKLWQNRQYLIWVISITCSMFGYYIPYVHLISYAVDMEMTKDEGSVLIMVLGGTSAFARLLFGKVLSFQFLKRRELHQLSMMITATATMMVTISKTMGGFIVYVIVLGLVDGCNVVLLPLLTRSYAGDCNVPIAWGILNGVSSITFILGPPVAGWLYDATGSYNEAFHVAGVPVLAGAAVLFFIPWAKRTTPKIAQQTVSGVDSQNLNRDNFSRMDSNQLIVGLPLTDHSSYTHSAENLATANTSQIRQYPDETTVLKDEPWGWRSSQQCIHVPSIEIDNPASPTDAIELQSVAVSGGCENRPISAQSNDSFVLLDNLHDSHTDVFDKDDFMQGTGAKMDKLSDSFSATNSPTLSPNASVVALVELVDVNETPGREPTAETVVPESRDTDIDNQSLQETHQTQEDSGMAAIVIPDYVVEKLVELNENDQNKTNAGAMVDTLVRLEDANEENKSIVENISVSEQLSENDSSLINTDYQTDKPQPGNRPFSRQPSESQCILSSSVVETLESLAQNPDDNADKLQNELTDNPGGVYTNSHLCVSVSKSTDQTQALWTSETANVPHPQDHPVSESQVSWPSNNITQPVYTQNKDHQQAPVWRDSSNFSPVPQNYENNVAQSQWTSSLADPATSVALSVAAVHAGSGYYQSSGTNNMPVGTENTHCLGPVVATAPLAQRSMETDGWTVAPSNDHVVHQAVQPWRQAASQTNIRDQPLCYTSANVPSATGQWPTTDMIHGLNNPNTFTDGSEQLGPAHYPGSLSHVYTSEVHTTSAQAYTSSAQEYMAQVVQQTPASYNAGVNGNLSFNTWTTEDVPVIADNSIHIPNIHAETNISGLQQSNMDGWWSENNGPSTSSISPVDKSSSTGWCGSATATDEHQTLKEPSPHSLQFADGDKSKTPQSSPTNQSSTNPFLDKSELFRSGSTEKALCFNSASLEGADRPSADSNADTLAAFDQFWQSRPSDSQTDTQHDSPPNDGAVG